MASIVIQTSLTWSGCIQTVDSVIEENSFVNVIGISQPFPPAGSGSE
jgi:hypothetical protein